MIFCVLGRICFYSSIILFYENFVWTKPLIQSNQDAFIQFFPFPIQLYFELTMHFQFAIQKEIALFLLLKLQSQLLSILREFEKPH